MSKRLFSNGLYNAIGVTTRIVASIVSIPLLIRLMGLENYGLWVLASTVIQAFIISDFGFSTATTIFLAKDISNNNHRQISETLLVTIGGTLCLAILSSIGFYFAANPISNQFTALDDIQRTTLTNTLRMGCIVIFSNLLSQALMGIENAYYRYDLTSRINIIQSLSLSMGQIFVASRGGSAYAIMQMYAVVSVILLLVNIAISNRLLSQVKVQWAFNLKRTKEIINYSFSIWMTGLGGILFARGDRIVVGFFLSTNTLGIYSAIVDISAAIYSFSAMPVQPLIPEISGNDMDELVNGKEFNSTLRIAFHMNALLICLSFTPLFIFSDFLLQLFIGQSDFSQDYIYSLDLALLIYSIFSFKAVGFYVLMSHSARQCMYIQIASSLATLLCIAIGSHWYGLMGAVLGNLAVLSTLSYNLLAMRSLQKKFHYLIETLSFPLAYISVLSVISLFISSAVLIKLSITIVGEVLLLHWFFKNHWGILSKSSKLA